MAKVKVLVVDDEDFNRQYLRICLEAAGFDLDEAVNGLEAWNMMQDRPDGYDAILLDRRMPEMDGMEVLHKLKSDDVLKHVPVVMQTALDREQDIIEAMEAGCYYYLTKPYDGQVLVSVVRSAVDEYSRQQRLQSEVAKRVGAIRLMTQGVFELRTPKEADSLAVLLASGFERSAAVAMGLSELLINAIEHGNLELDYGNKTDLIAEGKWDEVIAGRLAEPPFDTRTVSVDVRRDGDTVVFVITDQGKGFDWREYMDLTMERVFDTHGRGIAMARKLAFEKVEYKGAGNIVEVVVKGPANQAPVSQREDATRRIKVVGDPEPIAGIVDRLAGIPGIAIADQDSDAEADLYVATPGARSEDLAGAVAPHKAIFIGDGLSGPDAGPGKVPPGALPLPQEASVVEGSVRALLAPQTIDIGGGETGRLDSELSAHQKTLLPDLSGELGEGWTFAVRHEGCTGVSGDIWGGKMLPDGRVALFISDFTGHGPVAGVQSFRVAALAAGMDLMDEGPGAAMTQANALLFDALPTSQYAAMLMGVADPEKNTFTYAASGVPHPVVVRAGGAGVRIGDGKGLPLGVTGDSVFTDRVLEFHPGETLALFTDGVFSAVCGAQPGADAHGRVVDVLTGEESRGDDGADGDVAGRLMAVLDGAPRPLGDDITVICLTRDP